MYGKETSCQRYTGVDKEEENWKRSINWWIYTNLDQTLQEQIGEIHPTKQEDRNLKNILSHQPRRYAADRI